MPVDTSAALFFCDAISSQFPQLTHASWSSSFDAKWSAPERGSNRNTWIRYEAVIRRPRLERGGGGG